MADNAAKPRRLKPWMKGLGAALAGLLMIAAAIVVFTEQILKTGLEWVASTPDARLRIGRLRLVHAGDVRLSSITLADGQGVWATVPDLAIAWRPGALWSATAHVTAIRASRLDIARWPKGAESDTPFTLPTLAWPGLPVAVRLDQLTVAAITLPRTDLVLADVPPLTLAAKAVLDDKNLTLDARLAGPADDRAQLDLRLAPGGPGRVALDVQSGASGQITEALRAAGMAGLSHVRLNVGDLNPAAEHWRAKVDTSLGGLADFAGTLAATFDRETTLTLVGDIAPGPSLPALLGLSGDAAGPVLEAQKLSAKAELNKSGRITAAALALDATSWSVTARSDGAAVAKVWTVTATMDQPPTALTAPYRLGPIHITGALSQQDGGLHADMNMTVASITGPDVQAGRLETDMALAYDTDEKRLTVRSSGRSDGVKTPLPWLPSGPLRWTLAAASDQAAIKLTVEDVHDSRHRLTGTANLDRKTSALTAKGRLAVKDVRELSQGLRSGPLEADFTLNRQQGEMTLAFSATGNGSATGNAALDALGPLTAKGQVVVTPVLKADVTVDSSALTLSAQHDAEGGSRGTLTIRDGAALKPLLGVAVADGTTADVRRGQRGMMARLRAPWVLSPDKGLRDVSLSARLRGDLTTGQGGVLLTASTPVGPLRAASPIRLSADAVVVPDMIVDSPLATVLGGLTLNRHSGLIDGHLQGASGDLALLRRDYQVDAGGQLTLDITFAATPPGGQAIAAAVQGRHITLVLEDRETVDLDSLDLDGRVALGKGAPVTASGTLTVAGYRSALLTLDKATFSATAGTDGIIPWDFQANGYYAGTLNIAAAGTHAANPGGSTLQLNSITGELAGRPVALQAPTAVVWMDGGWRLDDLRMMLGDGLMEAAGQSNADGQQLDIQLKDADLKLLSLVTGLRPLGGTASGQARWRQTAVPELRSSGQLRLTLTQMDLAADQPISPFDAELNVTVDGTGATLPLKARLEATGADMSGVLDVTVPVTVHGSGLGSVPLDAPLAGSIKWRGAVAPLLLAWEADAHTVDGELVADLTLAGTRAAPQAQGDVRLVDGRYENLQWGSVLEDIAATVRLSGRRADIVALTASDGNGGKLTGSGHAVLALPGAAADLRAVLDNLRLIHTNEVSVRGTGDVGYIRNANQAQLSGGLKINQADVSLTVKLPPEVADLAVREINIPAQLALTGDTASSSRPPAKLALSISADRRVMVRGRGLDSEWRGDLKVGGDSDAPTLQGTLTVVRGDFDFAGKTFDLTEGSLRFTGGRNIDPLLLLRAEHETFDIKAKLILEGRLSQPRLTLTSVPALPQDEVLARILFGTNAQSLSALEAVQLAGAISALSSPGGGWDVFALARNALVLDRLTVDSPHDVNGDRSAGPQITGGKYLTDSVYLEVRSDTGTGQSNALLRLDITRNLQLESSAGSDNDNRLGIRWKKDY